MFPYHDCLSSWPPYGAFQAHAIRPVHFDMHLTVSYVITSELGRNADFWAPRRFVDASFYFNKSTKEVAPRVNGCPELEGC